MGTYNRAHLLDRAFQALLRQTFTDWELIVADDGSKDDTPSVVRPWTEKEPRIVFIRSEVNQGISRNYNMAFRKSRGELVSILDDDDTWCLEDKLTRQVEFLDTHPDYVGCGGGTIVVDPNGKEMYRFLKPETDAQIRRVMLFSNPMGNSTTMFRREIGERVGWYDSEMRYSGDRDFWMKMALAGKLYNFQEYESYYTMGTHNTSIVHIKPHLKASLMLTKRYGAHFPYYPPALAVSYAQYWYAFLPAGVRGRIHTIMARIKRAVAG
jgi:glycosyltransferase EpsE